VRDEPVFVGLGSNLGDREAQFRAALARLDRLPDTCVARCSVWRETAPWGITEQPGFLNAVAELRTGLEPEDLLRACKRIEAELGRIPRERWGPREIDLDLLLFGDRELRTATLTLPHPLILERPFVWEPLAELAPEVVERLRDAAVSLRGSGPGR
jgi:2-amino-4-hydroxy-6-hydroxymethyldihydropteridine diphosphokinase